MKTKRFQYSYKENASRLHKKIGEVLRNKNSVFAPFKIYQEYPVSKINTSYKNNRHKFDWVILDLFIVIEGMGEQHTKPSTFGGISKEQAEENFIDQKYRDTVKMDAAIEAGFTYLSIPYTDLDNINDNYILDLYNKHKNNNIIEQKIDTVKERFKQKQKTYYQELKRKRCNYESNRYKTDYSKTQDKDSSN